MCSSEQRVAARLPRILAGCNEAGKCLQTGYEPDERPGLDDVSVRGRSTGTRIVTDARGVAARRSPLPVFPSSRAMTACRRDTPT